MGKLIAGFVTVACMASCTCDYDGKGHEADIGKECYRSQGGSASCNYGSCPEGLMCRTGSCSSSTIDCSGACVVRCDTNADCPSNCTCEDSSDGRICGELNTDAGPVVCHGTRTL